MPRCWNFWPTCRTNRMRTKAFRTLLSLSSHRFFRTLRRTALIGGGFASKNSASRAAPIRGYGGENNHG